MLSAEEKDELLGSVRDIKKRQNEMYGELRTMTKAFPQNDLGDPDFDGHRKDHIHRREYDTLLDEYKVDATKKIIWAIITLVGVLLASGFSEHLKRAIS